LKKITILVMVFASLAGVGLLGNLIALDIQPFGIFGSLFELDGSKCSCKDVNGNYDPLNCQDFMGVYTDLNGVCAAIAPTVDYGNSPSEVQGCSANFWAANADTVINLPVWPTGYSPDNSFNQMFQTTIQFSDLTETIEEENADEQENSAVFGINEEVVESTGEEVVESTGEEVVESTGEEVVESTGEEVVESTGEEVVESTGEEVEMNQGDENKLANNADVIDDKNKNGLKLVQALKLKEGNLDLLIREAVAAMLNAAHPQIHYPYSVSEIMTMTQIAISSGNYDETMDLLKKANDVGNSPLCPASGILVSP